MLFGDWKFSEVCGVMKNGESREGVFWFWMDFNLASCAIPHRLVQWSEVMVWLLDVRERARFSAWCSCDRGA